MKAELLLLDAYAQKLEDNLSDTSTGEDVVRALPRLSVPALADQCLIDVIEGEQSVRCAFAHRDPSAAVSLAGALDKKAELFEFREGRRALAGRPVLFEF